MTFLVDFDNTISDNYILQTKFSAVLEKIVGNTAAQTFMSENEEFLEHNKIVDFPLLVRETFPKHALAIFNNMPVQECLHKKVLEVVKHLKTMGKIFIFTEGDIEYQTAKITNSGLLPFADKVFVYEHKLAELQKILNTVKNDEVIYMDDNASNLEFAKKIEPKIKTIWIRQGFYRNTQPLNPDNIDITVNEIQELISYEFGK